LFRGKLFFILLLAGLLLFLLFNSPATAHSDEESAYSSIISSGKGIIVDQNQANARNEAMENAMQIIVEHAVNLIIDSDRIINNYELLKQKIFLRSSRYIQSYRSFYENPDMSLNQFEVGLQAVVSMGNLKSDLALLGFIEEEGQKPKMLVIIEEKISLQPIEYGDKPTVSEIALKQNLQGTGFQFIDTEPVRKDTRKEHIEQTVSNNSKAAAALGFQYGANVVIAGKTIVQEKTRTGMDGTVQKFLQANISASVVDVKTESIIVTGSENNTALLGEESLADAHSRLINETCQKLSAQFINKLAAYSPKNYEASSKMYLTIENVTVPQLFLIRSRLHNEPGRVVRYSQKSFIKKVAVAEVDFTGDMDSLVNMVVQGNYETFTLKLSDLTANRVRIQVNP
jgi:hypothetical protein